MVFKRFDIKKAILLFFSFFLKWSLEKGLYRFPRLLVIMNMDCVCTLNHLRNKVSKVKCETSLMCQFTHGVDRTHTA